MNDVSIGMRLSLSFFPLRLGELFVLLDSNREWDCGNWELGLRFGWDLASGCDCWSNSNELRPFLDLLTSSLFGENRFITGDSPDIEVAPIWWELAPINFVWFPRSFRCEAFMEKLGLGRERFLRNRGHIPWKKLWSKFGLKNNTIHELTHEFRDASKVKMVNVGPEIVKIPI